MTKRQRRRRTQRRTYRGSSTRGPTALAVGAGAVLALPAGAQAADFTVTNLTDGAVPGPAGSLRKAVSDANATPAADRVLFQSGMTGVITLTNGQISINEPLEIAGPGPGKLTVSGGGASRIFYSYPVPVPQPPEAVTFSGLRLTGGAADTGGAIRGLNAAFTLANTVVTGNTATSSAGGVYNYQGTLAVRDSTISGNTVTNGAGGGIRTFSTPITVLRSTVSGNSAGGSNGGGGIYAYVDSLAVTDSTISGNTSVGDGGGISTFATAITIQTSTISGNSVTVANTDGGGIYSYQASLSLQSSTIAGNSAPDDGGGIYRYPAASAATLTNTIVADNTAPAGPDLNGLVNATFSLIENTLGGTVGGAGPNLTGVDPKLAALADNGGPTQTRALVLGSPALDKGLATGADQRGAPRPFDLKGIASAAGGNGTDIGAYERVLCGGKLVNRVGTAGADALVGTKKSDGMLGLGGKDKLKGRGGKDGLCGGAGKDKLKGEGGNDVLLGQAGVDSLIGGKGKDKLKGGAGKDKQKQ